MVKISSFKKIVCLLAVCLFDAHDVWADNLTMNTAQMQALDKVTGQMSVINVPVNGEVRFGSFSIVVRNCQKTPPEEVPENYAFVDVADTNKDGKIYNIFKGWMISSSPSLNSVEHPVYDVWLLKCINSPENQLEFLTAEELAQRDNLEKYKETDLSKEAQIAIEIQEEQDKKAELARIEKEEHDRLQKEEQLRLLRQKEIDKELQTNNGKVIDPEPDTDLQSDDGPVSLLNIGKQVQQKTTDEVFLDSSEAEIGIVANVSEDTNSEALELPEDIEEIIPQQ